ncbi:glycosyltransferase family 4 protein [Bradyrhizobium sp. URHC0002]
MYVIVAKAIGYDVVVTPHLGLNWKSQRNLALRTLSQLMLSRADRIALLSRTQEWEILLPTSVERLLIRTFLPSEVLEPISHPSSADHSKAVPPAELRLIHASRLSVAKGSFLVVDVCSRLREAGVPFSAQIIGSADEQTRSALRERIKDRNLSNQVQLLDWASPERMIDHLRGADVLIHLSLADSYPLIVLEALASGTLPLALDLAGVRSIVQDYDGLLVSRYEPVEEAVAHLMNCGLQDIRSRGVAQVARVRTDFAWSTAGTLLIEALEATKSSDRGESA